MVSSISHALSQVRDSPGVVTWDSSYFSADDISIQVEGDYGNGMGFASETLDGKRGFYAWNVTDELAQEVKENNSTLLVALSIVIVNSSSVDTGRREKGPTVILTQADSKGPESSNIGVLIVVLPSFLGIALLVVAGAIWVINRRRRGASFVPSWLASFIGSTKGARSRTQLPDRSTTVSPGINKRNPQYDIQLTERDSWSATSLGREPHPGRNVFRDEMARQNRDRG